MVRAYEKKKKKEVSACCERRGGRYRSKSQYYVPLRVEHRLFISFNFFVHAFLYLNLKNGCIYIYMYVHVMLLP